MGDFHFSVDSADFVEVVDFWGNAAVDAPDFVVDDDGEGQVVEDVGAVSPDVESTVL